MCISKLILEIKETIKNAGSVAGMGKRRTSFFPFVGAEDKYVLLNGEIVKADPGKKEGKRVDLTYIDI